MPQKKDVAEKQALAAKKAQAEKQALATKKAQAEKQALATKKVNSQPQTQLDSKQKRDSRTELLTVSVSLNAGKIVGVLAIGIFASAVLVSAMVFIAG